jgi:plasmid stabilization system protein ParE
MARLIWLPEAKADLQRLYEFIQPHSPDAAARAVQHLVRAEASLQDFPQKGRLWQPDPAFRELPVAFGARGYVIRYRKHDDQVVIVRVWHALEDR